MTGRTKDHEITHTTLALSKLQRREMVGIEHGTLLVLEPTRLALDPTPMSTSIQPYRFARKARIAFNVLFCLVQ